MTNQTSVDPNKEIQQDDIPENSNHQDRDDIRGGERSTNNTEPSDSKSETEDHLIDGAPNSPKPKQEGDNPKDLDQPEEKFDDQTAEK